MNSLDLGTSYLGLHLRNPLIVGASPFCDNLDRCTELVEAGVAAFVMHSLFAEQLETEAGPLREHTPLPGEYALSPGQYLKQLSRLRKALPVPVLASLHARTLGSWVSYALLLQDAGASALELNLHHCAADRLSGGDPMETELIEIVQAVAAAVEIPVAVKLSPFHTALGQLALLLEQAGASGIVLFNPGPALDIDVQELETVPRLPLSTAADLPLRLQWLTLLAPRLKGALACSGGVHTAEDVVKALLAGAHVVQIVSALLRHGPVLVPELLSGLRTWMHAHGYTHLDQCRGRLGQARRRDAAALERSCTIRALQSWRT